MVELALVMPLFMMLLFGIVILGLGVFFQQQVTNAAREAARYASVHSATAVNPTTSTRSVNPTIPIATNNDVSPDNPSARWPAMTAAARNSVFGLDRSRLRVSACWSGFWQVDAGGAVMPNTWDAGPSNGLGQPNAFLNCSLPTVAGANVDPRTGLSDPDPASPGVQPGGSAADIPCSSPLPLTTTANDTASNVASSQVATATEITVFACYVWQPPLAGFLLIPPSVTLRAVVSEAIQYQQ